MSSPGLAEILNRRIWWAELQESWAPITATAVQELLHTMFGQELCREQEFAEAATRCERALTIMCWTDGF